MINFSHLHTHSKFSFRDGMSRVPKLVNKAIDLNMPAIALTDHGGMHGIMELFVHCKFVNQRRSKQGLSTILPIAGCEVFVSDKKYHLVLLAKNLQGYHNLCMISSSGYLRDDYKPNGKPIVEWSTIEQYHEGLICLSGCIGGELAQAILKSKNADEILLRHQSLFGEDYYIEIQRHETYKENACTETYGLQKQVEPILLALARKYGVKVVATNDSHFLNEDDAEAHDALLQLNYGRLGKPAFHFSKQEWFKSQEEMAAIFADIPEVLTNTQNVVDKIESYDITKAPVCPKGEWQDPDTALMLKATLGMVNRFGVPSEEVEERLKYELEVFKEKRCADYILFWWDIIRACREELNVPFSPGRSSYPGSLALYCLGITDVNPLEHDLLFERFFNVDSVGLPDIDIEFADSGRMKVVEYIRRKYGDDCVAHIITYGTRTKYAAPIQKLEDLVYRLGIHACGLVIAPNPISNYVPLCKVLDKGSNQMVVVTQYDGHSVEDSGLIKFDLLGLGVIDMQQEILQSIKTNHGKSIDLSQLPLDDNETLSLFHNGDTDGIIMFESDAIRKYLSRIKHLTFDNLVAIHTLYLPGQMDLIPSYIRRCNGKEPVTCDFPEMERYLNNTAGLMIYQEQLMLAARQIGNLSRLESDKLRKAMGKKKVEVLDALWPKFLTGGLENGHSEAALRKVWEDWKSIGCFLFCKSHAVAYAILAYRSAYLKAHYPKEFEKKYQKYNQFFSF